MLSVRFITVYLGNPGINSENQLSDRSLHLYLAVKNYTENITLLKIKHTSRISTRNLYIKNSDKVMKCNVVTFPLKLKIHCDLLQKTAIVFCDNFGWLLSYLLLIWCKCY
jgi:hypothetical protein